ncbi:hypothetical protein [Constantimarinum furrinae]|uniref:Uncharacterized protein n=1 Tax=Constantimarinum furrinae TaxID=2562285 RepID=A0A7G8PUZ5_9FLAO|nr:hypothetical protein [Constantimarinum furrinae]QNJ98161.1 hypothetical protein ALE3EI_1605 [Constantimarinum furrinae]
MARKFHIRSELSEKQVEADVATYFGWISPPYNAMPFRLIDVNEQLTGADKRVDLIVPMYLQFKVSHGLTAIDTKFNLNYLSNKPHQRIRKFRKEKQLNDNPTLFFKLREMADNAEDYQHNILLKLNGQENVSAFYVAPLDLKKDSYVKNLFNSMYRFRYHPFDFGVNSIYQRNWVSYFGFVPFLRSHVSIFPHEKVNTARHYYSFDQNGSDIGWHSSEYFRVVSRLSDTLTNIFDSAFYNKQSWLNPYSYIETLESDFGFLNNNNNINSDLNPIERIQDFGRELYNRYHIKQVLLTTTVEKLTKLNNG